ncbi:MAG: transposase [Spirochaetaceae bacterium]|nr:transposase [Spirochaetaceae bacterium]
MTNGEWKMIGRVRAASMSMHFPFSILHFPFAPKGRGLPHDFPKWNLVYYHYQIWSAEGPNGEASVLDRALRKLADL